MAANGLCHFIPTGLSENALVVNNQDYKGFLFSFYFFPW